MFSYTPEQIDWAYNKIQQLIHIVNALEGTFRGRYFTMDGHMLDSIGKIMAAYYYKIKLYEASTSAHDGIDEYGREVQIKITQQDRINISDEPIYLIVLHLDRNTGSISEIYNGPGKVSWEAAHENAKDGRRHILVSRLLELDSRVENNNRIVRKNFIEKYVNIASVKIGSIGRLQNEKSTDRKRKGRTLVEGYVNKNNQKNCGCTYHAGTLKGQNAYKMKCGNCGFEYEANGCDVWLRKCPRCM